VNYLEQKLHWFQAQSTQRKLTLGFGVTLIASITLFLSIWAVSPSYGVLFNHLDSQDANQILTQLEQANIVYQVRNHGSDILIDKQLIDKTRIKLMSTGMQFTHSVGFELFDKTDFGMTDFSQKINYQRALQGELERTINSLDEIKQARVHLVIPESQLFQQQDNLPRAAVTLHLKKSLTPRQVKSIQQLIMASVAHLPLSNVVIVDQNGNSLTADEDDTSTSHFSAKKTVEHYLNEKVMQMLNRIFSHQGVLVKIDATLNYDELDRELIKPQHAGLVTHEKETQHLTPNKNGKKTSNQDFTREKNYEFGHEKEHFTRANGTIERLTISVVLPQKTDKEKMNQIERLVKSVVGFDAKRGDTISIEGLLVEHTITQNHKTTQTPGLTILKPLIYCGMTGLFVLFLIALWWQLNVRAKRRKHLLAELGQWLIEHD
jgi:flagellar M-ring protein FliF